MIAKQSSFYISWQIHFRPEAVQQGQEGSRGQDGQVSPDCRQPGDRCLLSSDIHMYLIDMLKTSCIEY